MKQVGTNRSKVKSLTAQIRETERRIWNRRGEANARATDLVRKIHQRMIAPVTLFLAGGMGFVIGELTQRQTTQTGNGINKPDTAVTTPWRTALNLISSAHTLYTALPIAWLLTSLRRRTQPDSAASSGTPLRETGLANPR